MATKETTATDPAMKMLDPKLIDIEKGWNPRLAMTDIDKLMAQIKSVKQRDPRTGGLLQNLIVKAKPNGHYKLVSGERRLTAINRLRKAGEDFPFGIPCKIAKPTETDTELLLEDFMANDSVHLTPLERGRNFLRLREAGMTIAAIEKATGVSDNTIIDEIALVQADPELKQAVKDKKVTATVAKAIAVTARGDKAKQKALTKKAIAAGRDSKKRDALNKDIDKARRSRAAQRGQTLKMKPVSPIQLQELGLKAQKYLHVKIKEAKIEAVQDIRGWVAKDNERACAYQYGVMDALRTVAGAQRVSLDI